MGPCRCDVLWFYVFGRWQGNVDITRGLSNLVALELVVNCAWSESSLLNIAEHCKKLIRLRLEGVCVGFQVKIHEFENIKNRFLDIREIYIEVSADDRYLVHRFMYPGCVVPPFFLSQR